MTQSKHSLLSFQQHTFGVVYCVTSGAKMHHTVNKWNIKHCCKFGFKSAHCCRVCLCSFMKPRHSWDFLALFWVCKDFFLSCVCGCIRLWRAAWFLLVICKTWGGPSERSWPEGSLAPMFTFWQSCWLTDWNKRETLMGSRINSLCLIEALQQWSNMKTVVHVA